MPVELRVVATAGHVDHGKSSLIVRLTGMDPDRWAEEKRRGLTIDLGYAWTTLPSGREIGFVDVPGHERFIGNMLAGVGPVRLVMFVVAADEGWKPQSEEHLQILDVLGTTNGVVALTKADLVDGQRLSAIAEEVRARLAGTGLADAPIVAVSARTSEGIDGLATALDTMLEEASPPEPTRPRLFVDRVFTIAGAGTVVTGTLTGECLSVGDEAELYPSGLRARIRGLQTHERTEESACPVSRVAANLVGAERRDVARGDVLARPGTWRPTELIEVVLRPVRGLAHPITARGAFKLYAGAADVDAKLRFLDASELTSGDQGFVRIRLSAPMVIDVFDRFVLREAGRRQTVAGGTVLDVAPPARAGNARERLSARAAADREALPALLAAERGAVKAGEAATLTGASVDEGTGEWLLGPGVAEAVSRSLTTVLEAHHRDHPLDEGADLVTARAAIGDGLRSTGAPRSSELIEVMLDAFAAEGVVVRTSTSVRLPTHRVALEERNPEVEGLLAALAASPTTPPTVKDLVEAGHGRDVVDAASRSGVVVRVSPEFVFLPEVIDRATGVVQGAGDAGITVSAFREAMGTSRKYAVPLLGWLDRTGVTRREGDLRYPRGG